MTRQPIGLHAPTHAPDGQDPLDSVLTVKNDADSPHIFPTDTIIVGDNLTLTNPSDKVARIDAQTTSRSLPRFIYAGADAHVSSSSLWTNTAGWTVTTNDVDGTVDVGITTAFDGLCFKVVDAGGGLQLLYVDKDCPPGILFFDFTAQFTSWDSVPAGPAAMETGISAGTFSGSNVLPNFRYGGGGLVQSVTTTAAKPIPGGGGNVLEAWATCYMVKYDASSGDIPIVPAIWQDSGQAGHWQFAVSITLLDDWPSS